MEPFILQTIWSKGCEWDTMSQQDYWKKRLHVLFAKKNIFMWMNFGKKNLQLVLINAYSCPVIEQRVTVQWSSIVSDLDFCNHHWFGCALLSFNAGMHGGYFWRTKEPHRAGGRRRTIMVRGGAAIMIWSGGERMATEELAIQRLGVRFWSGRLWKW